MRAVVLNSYGDANQLTIEEIDTPSLKPGHVLIRVQAASVNPIDIKIRSGLSIGPSLPGILGCDFAGIVEQVADDVAVFSAGDKVYGCAGGVRGLGGTLAEYIVCDADLLAHMPSTLSFREAAAIPLVGITAWHLNERAQVSQGQHVLIHAGLGGVGHMAIQLAKSRGARVATTVRNTTSAGIARQLGADDIILYPEESVDDYVQRLTSGVGFDAVIDTVGGTNLDKSLQAAAVGGCVAVCAARSTHDLSPMHAKALSLHAIFMLLPLLTGKNRPGHGRILSRLTALSESGQLYPLLDSCSFALEQAAQAHKYLESGQAKGKIVIDIA